MLRRSPAAGGRVRRPAHRPEHTLSPDWRVWAAENLLVGRTREDVAAVLVTQGVSVEEAAAQVAGLAASPALAAARRYVAQTRRLELVTRLLAEHARTAPHATEVERRAGVTPEEFFDRYYATNTPVVLTDVVTRWRAFGLWSPDYLKSRVGDVEVLAAFGREGDPDYDMNTPKHSRPVRFADFIDQVVAAGETNDLYLVANHRNMDRAALQTLYDDVTLDPAVLDPKRLAGSVALWVGPGGTVTPLHHDTSNILFGQVYGQKRFRLIAPWETALLPAMRGVYSRLDPEAPDLARYPDYAKVTVKDVTLSPGDMLFIPVGWWHHVRSLSLSINLAFTNFTRTNAFDWYRPGEVR
jgi:hypothetical protein